MSILRPHILYTFICTKWKLAEFMVWKIRSLQRQWKQIMALSFYLRLKCKLVSFNWITAYTKIRKMFSLCFIDGIIRNSNNKKKMGGEIHFLKSLLFKARVYLDIGKINTVEITEHLVDLRSVLKHSPSCLSQVIKRCVSSQSLGKGTYSGNLWKKIHLSQISSQMLQFTYNKTNTVFSILFFF